MYHLFLRKLGSPIQQSWKWKRAFSSLCLSCIQETPHRPLCSACVPAPGPRPVTPGWSTARQGWLWLWLWGWWELPVTVYRVFLRRRETKGVSWPPALWSSRSSAHTSLGRPKSRKEAPRCTLYFRNYSSHRTLGLLLPPLCHLHPSICSLRSQAGEFIGE